MKYQSYYSKAISSATIIACIAGTCTQSALAVAPTIPEYINDSNSADFYWPFENSFISDIQDGLDRTKPSAVESNGILDNGCPPPMTSTSPLEYFPILANHMTRVGGSSAIIFGETTGNISGVDRYLELDDSNFNSTESLVALNMHHKEEWTMHMIVSPDEEDIVGTRGWETLFDHGNDDATSGPVQILVQLERDTDNSETTFQVITESQNLIYPQDTRHTIEVVVNDADVDEVNGRHWYQVIVQYYKIGTQGNIRMYVNTVYEDQNGKMDFNQETASRLSNEWRSSTSTDSARIGKTRAGTNHFNGALHHFAIWKGLIDTSYNTSKELNKLAEAFVESSSIANAPADARSELSIDWDAPVRFFTWDQPTSTATLVGSERDLRNWTDPIWDMESVYPLVRMRVQSPENSAVIFTPPGYSPQSTLLPEPTQLAGQTKNWLQYLNTGMETYASDIDSKSLFDQDACALLWHNYTESHNNQSCYYGDADAIRRLTNDWRDVPSIWRDASTHPTLTGTITYDETYSEVNAPFYREGMSINAFRSKDIFIELAKQIEAANDPLSTEDPVPTPSRFHFDSEELSTIGQAWGGTTGPSYIEGWWEESAIDDRASDVASWVPPSNPSSTFHTLDDIKTSAGPDLSQSRYDGANNATFRAKFSVFARDQYDQAFGVSLLLPALQELSPDIRLSEYNMVYSDPTVLKPERAYLRNKPGAGLETVLPQWIDFSSPILYPIKLNHIRTYTNASTPRLLAEWGDQLGIDAMLQTDDMFEFGRTRDDTAQTLTEYRDAIVDDLRVIFVELAKYNINANYLSGVDHGDAPTVPWLIYPEANWSGIHTRFDWNDNGVVDSADSVIYRTDWQQVARVAVFAHRHGVREFLMWGNWDEINDVPARMIQSVEGLENVFKAVADAADAPSGFTTSADFTFDSTSTNLDYGIPNGTVDYHDMLYFAAMYSAGDLEADIAGAGPGTYGCYPDGIVDSNDSNYYAAIYAATP
ncbi:MAG: GC-type dockerin domain-anchored protein [Phycisphaerales bacterium]|nr:GC-type dockerin domain-anchored protein [Phycisphaerales bacterium]